jgi:uncharacterized protein
VTDDLNAPLGQDSANKKRRLALPFSPIKAIAGALGLALATFVLWTTFSNDPLGGEPVVIVSADPSGKAPASNPATAEVTPLKPETAPGAVVPSGAPVPPGTATPPGSQTVTIINGMSGKRDQVVIPASQDASPVADPRVVETTRHGAIPRVGADGSRAAEVYARPTGARTNGPRIALVVQGLGISAAGTSEALGKLPGPVTLAFAPYGTELTRWATRARNEGHEVLLQVPMEPFDYPDNDPGPQTLLTSLTPAQNIDRLHWFMSRFQGYVGVANYMGARFTANEQAVGTILRETSKRGLLYFDDGSSARSLASQIAGANNTAFARADIVLDAAPTPAAIDAALAKLEAIARERGSAVGAASALPVSIDRIAQWAKAVESRGLTLVPISAIAAKPKSS